jgi:16S rRNA processing protein RimM
MPSGRIELGVIGRAHGVRGLVKVTSHTADPADLTAYGPLSDAHGRLYDLRWKAAGVAEVSRIIDGAAVKVADRSAAEKLTNTRLYVDRSALPPADQDEYYLTDLIGLTVTDQAGQTVGTVSVVHDYGAGASLEIATHGTAGSGASLIVPFTAACVPTVDLPAGQLVVALPNEIIVAPDASADRDSASEPDAARSAETTARLPAGITRPPQASEAAA